MTFFVVHLKRNDKKQYPSCSSTFSFRTLLVKYMLGLVFSVLLIIFNGGSFFNKTQPSFRSQTKQPHHLQEHSTLGAELFGKSVQCCDHWAFENSSLLSQL